MAITKRTKQTISKESMFNRIMPSLNAEESDEELVESNSEEKASKTTKSTAKKTTTKKTK